MESSQRVSANWSGLCIALAMCHVMSWSEVTAADVDIDGVRWVLTSEMRVMPVFPTNDIWKSIDTNQAGVEKRIHDLLSDDKTLIPTHIALTLRYDPTEIWYERHSTGLTIHANLLTIEVTDERSGEFKQCLEYPNLESETSSIRFHWEKIASEPATNPIPSDADWRMYASSSMERQAKLERFWKGDVRPRISDAQLKRTIDAIKSLSNANVVWKTRMWSTYPVIMKDQLQVEIEDCGSMVIQLLIEMLDDPDKFAVAHVLLLELAGRKLNSRRDSNSRTGAWVVVCDQLIVNLDEKIPIASYPDSRQQQAWLRTFWSIPIKHSSREVR